MKYRNEWKYICHESDLKIIGNKLGEVLRCDEHASDDGKYTIKSLYFDDYNNTCIFDNDAGLGKRYKWRIRYYNNNPSKLSLERKEKNKGLCRKLSCPLTIDEYYKIVNGSAYDVLQNTEFDLLKKFCVDIVTKMFAPKVIIEYERTAYVEPISNVRITMDRNICASNQIDRFIDGTYTKTPLQESNTHVYEVKFDDILPSYIKQAAYTKTLKQITFSKYYLSRSFLERN